MCFCFFKETFKNVQPVKMIILNMWLCCLERLSISVLTVFMSCCYCSHRQKKEAQK